MKVAQSFPFLLFATPWPIQSMEFSRPEYWSGQPFPSPGIFPTQGLNPALPHCRWIFYQLSHKGYCNFKNWNNNPIASELCIDSFIYVHWHLLDVSSGWTKSKWPLPLWSLLSDVGYRHQTDNHTNTYLLESCGHCRKENTESYESIARFPHLDLPGRNDLPE